MKIYVNQEVARLPEAEHSALLFAVGSVVANGFREEQAFAFIASSNGSSTSFKRIGNDGLFLEFSYHDNNYPLFTLRVMRASDVELKIYISDTLAGWEVKKSQFDDIKTDKYNAIEKLAQRYLKKDGAGFSERSLKTLRGYKGANASLKSMQQQVTSDILEFEVVCSGDEKLDFATFA